MTKTCSVRRLVFRKVDAIDAEILRYKFATALVRVAIEEGIPYPGEDSPSSAAPSGRRWPWWEPVVVRRGQGVRRPAPEAVPGAALLSGPAPSG